jgi:GNAT superfamily N-acetyltransferase
MLHISTDPSLLDLPFIHGFLTTSYWAKGRTLEEMETIVAHSLNFGAYVDGNQVAYAYARVVTDRVQFAYLMDVFVDPELRGNGYSKQLMAHVFEHELLSDIKLWRLGTKDAHGLYAQFGFTPLAEPANLMERKR